LKCVIVPVTVGRHSENDSKLNCSRVFAVPMIYKICPAPAWREAERHGSYRGSADDARDGFIHFSTAAQVAGTLAKHFAGQPDLFLVAVDADALGDALQWEPSRGGDLFPHLYGELDPAEAQSVMALTLRADGSHHVPELVS
jgi:uncharacterized protein (DUF952 family)